MDASDSAKPEIVTPKTVSAETSTSMMLEDEPPPKKKYKKKPKTDKNPKNVAVDSASSEVASKKKKTAKIEETKVEIATEKEEEEQLYLTENYLSENRTQHKLENYIRNDLVEVVVDEISLEGLDGITIEALWTRISDRISEPLPLSTDIQESAWNIAIKFEKIKFYLLQEPRSKLVVFNRFKCFDMDTGHITEPDETFEDIYPFHPICEQEGKNVCFGSCVHFNTRVDISNVIRQLSLAEAQLKYGSKLIMVADQCLRNRALGLDFAKSLNKLSNIHYCILERIGRSRKLGEVTAGKNSLLRMSGSKTLFYLRKQLLANDLITKQQFSMRNAKTGSTSALLFHLRRFYTEHKTMKTLVTEQIIDILKKKSNYRIEYLELKRIIGLDAWVKGVQKIIKSPEFRQYVHTDLLVPYRTMYPNASPKEWKVKSGSREKNLRVLELINPAVNLSVNTKEDEVKEDSSDDEPIGEFALNFSVFNQTYDIVHESGSEGVSLKQVQRKLGLDFYIVRSVLSNMLKRNLIETRAIDVGRQHILKYYVHTPAEQDKIDKKPQNSDRTIEESNEEDLSFIADVLEVNKDELVANRDESVEEESVKEDPFKGHFDFIQDYRTTNRLERFQKKYKEEIRRDENNVEKNVKVEERDQYESIFKNEHPFYPMTLSLEHKRIEAMELDIKVDDAFADVFKFNIKEEEDAEASKEYDYLKDSDDKFDLNPGDLEKIKLSSKPTKTKLLLGSGGKASGIMRKYVFLPVDINVDILLKKFHDIIEEIKKKSTSKILDFPEDLQSDDERYANTEKADKMSTIVNIEDPEGIDLNDVQDDPEIEEFKANLLKRFEDGDCTFVTKSNFANLYADSILAERLLKRKIEDVTDDPSKKIKLSESEKGTETNASDQQALAPENADAILKKITESVNMDIYMGRNPVLLSYCLDEDNIETTVITTESVENPQTLDKYVNKTLSQRSVARANLILETVNREKIISDIPKLTNLIKNIENEKKLLGIVDRKSVNRLIHRLVTSGHVKVYKIILKFENIVRCKNIICVASLDISNTIQVFIDQMKIAFFIYAKKKTDLIKPSTSGASTESTDLQSFDSYEEMVALTSNSQRPKYKYNRTVARQYGYVPKFAKIKILHELLFYLIYSYDGQAIDSAEVPKLLKQFHVKLDDNSVRELGTLYKRELSWKMFIPPLPKYKDWPSGWALICDVILRLPLSIFVKVFNIAYVIPELIPLLNDPVRKHVLLKNVPADIRNACLHNRKCIFSIHEILCHLCYMGLLQFGVQKLKEKEQQFIYLNRKGILYDTTSSDFGYNEITRKEYPILQFYFESQTILDNYWAKLWSISMNTKLGQRYSVMPKTITLLDIHAKMIESAAPKSPEAALEADVGYIPGDRLGACCFDSSSWVHVKRNWIWSSSIKKGKKVEMSPVAALVGMRKKHLEQIKVKPIKYKDLQRELNKKKLKGSSQSKAKIESKVTIKKSKKFPIIRKLGPRSTNKMKSLKYDDLDTKIMKKMGKSRAIWFVDEDVNILICNSAIKFLCPNPKKKVIAPLIIRDVMHRLCSNRRRKTSVAYVRRCAKLLKSDNFQENERYTYCLESDKYVQKVFSKFRFKIANGEAIPNEHVHIAFVYLVSYLVNSYKKKFKSQQKILGEDGFIDYLTAADIPKYLLEKDAKDAEILYQDPKTTDEIKVVVIKDIIHCSLGWKSESSELPLMLYRAYQHYPDHLLKEAISCLREQQVIAGKKFTSKHWNVKEGIHMAGNLIHNSFLYCFKQITKYPDYIYPEAYQMFVSIYKRHDLEREFLVEKFEQGHGLGLSEIACLQEVVFSFKIPDDLLILDPNITDHSQLIQELAVRYKFLIQQRKTSHESFEQDKIVGDATENVQNVEKAIEVIFEAQKQKNLNIDRNVKDKLIFSGNDVVLLTEMDNPTTQKKPVQIEDKTAKVNAQVKEQQDDTKASKNEDTIKALQDLTSYLGNKQGESSLKISDLAYLLTKGLFPELDDDEERLEKLSRHFLIMYPSSTFYLPQSISGTVWAEEILNKARTKGEEMQEMIRTDCIVKNTSHNEEISNSMIDIGGDDEDIKLAFSIVNYIKQKGVYGASSTDLKNEFTSLRHNLELHEIVMVLIKVGIVFRAGVKNIRFVHVTENEIWTVGLDDERPISEFNLNSLGVRLKLMPWVGINGTLNLKVFHSWLNVIQSHCLSYPFVMLTALMKRFNFLKPVDIFSLLEYLQVLDCLKLYTYEMAKPVTLLSPVEILEKRPVNILDEFGTIFVETDKAAIIKIGAFNYKGQTDIDIPFEE